MHSYLLASSHARWLIRKGSSMAKSVGCFTPLPFPTGIAQNPSDRDSHLSEHSPPCEEGPVQTMYGMTAAFMAVIGQAVE